MDDQPNDIISPAPDSAKTPQSDGRPATPGTWETYLTGKKISPAKFMSRMTKGEIVAPDSASLDRVAAAFTTNPPLFSRLTALLNAVFAGHRAERIVTDMIEAIIRRTVMKSLPTPVDSAAYQQSVASWVESIPKKPLKPRELAVLSLLLSYGHRRQLLDDESIMDLVAAGIVTGSKNRSKRQQATRIATRPIDVVLATVSGAPVLSALVAHTNAWRAELRVLDQQFREKQDRVAALETNCAEKDQAIAGLDEAINTFRLSIAAADATIADLRRQLVDLGDGWQHRLDEVRGRMRGVLQGQLTRWLQTALDAASSEPPFTKAIEERLQDALRVIEGELQWLQRSD